MPRLTRLVMRNVEYGQLFALFNFPSLRNLSIDPVENQEPMEIVWGKLHVPPVTTVNVEYLVPRHGKISITGSSEGSSFSLTERAAEARTARMIRSLSNAPLASVTTLSVGRGVPELGVQLPSASICDLIAVLPHLRRLDLFPSKLTAAVTEYLQNNPLVCPELRILSLTAVSKTHEDLFWSLSKLAADRRNANLQLHRIDLVVLMGGNARETAEHWETMTGLCRFGDLVRCNCGGEVRQTCGCA